MQAPRAVLLVEKTIAGLGRWFPHIRAFLKLETLAAPLADELGNSYRKSEQTANAERIRRHRESCTFQGPGDDPGPGTARPFDRDAGPVNDPRTG